MEHKGPQTIETKRLLLRKFNENDAEAMFKNWESDDKVTEFLCWNTVTDMSTAEQILKDWIQGYNQPDFYQWAIVPSEVGEPIGTISVVKKNDNLGIVQIGYCIGSKWWNKGITSEAFKAIIPFSLKRLA